MCLFLSMKRALKKTTSRATNMKMTLTRTPTVRLLVAVMAQCMIQRQIFINLTLFVSSHSQLRRSEEGSEIGEESSSHTPSRSTEAAAAAAALRWLRQSAADLTSIRESIHVDATSLPSQQHAASPVTNRRISRRELGGGERGQQLPRSPAALVRESIHVEDGGLGGAFGAHENGSPRQRVAAVEWVRESLHLPATPPPAAAVLGAADGERWGVGSRSGCDVAGGEAVAGNEAALCGTMSIVERIQQLDRQKKQAVARSSAAGVAALVRGFECTHACGRLLAQLEKEGVFPKE
jgi:hypothetical protein